MSDVKMKLQINANFAKSKEEKTLESRGIFITPPVGDGYWMYKVDVGHGQTVIGFPKFGIVGIGFLKEKDWNTNLPSKCEAEKIYRHIAHNKTKGPKKSDCIKAIQMIQEAVAS